MEYIFEATICTNDDFAFPFVPCDMERFVDGTYSLKKSYENRVSAIVDVTNICTFLKEHIETNSNWTRETWVECVDNFVESLHSSKEGAHELVEEYMSGMYEGTELIFRAKPCGYDVRLDLTDEEYEMIRKNVNGVTLGMIKNSVLKLFREGEEK